MSAGSLMSIGTRALAANYAALATTGHNIANANVEGYSRQQVELETNSGQFTGAGFFGRGVNVASVTRAHDQFLTREAALSRALAAGDEARLAQLERLESIFETGEAGLGHAANQLLNAFVDVANHPQDLPARQVVLARAGELASRFRSASARIDELQTGVAEEIGNSVAAVNALAEQVAAINRQITAARGTGHAPNDLLDQRDRLIGELNGYLQVTTIAADDGSLSVFVGGGQRLVLGGVASRLEASPDPYDANRLHLAIREGASLRQLDDSSLGGGRIAGLLRFQGDDLVDARNKLGQIIAGLGARLNEQQSFGLDLRIPPGSGAPIFSVGAARVLPASSNARDASGNFVANVAITVIDAGQLQASDYHLRVDPSGPPGSYQLTRLADGLVRNVAAGDVVDGFRIDIPAPAPAATDSFLLQPVATAASLARRVLDDPRGVAAASRVAATLASTNTGTASVASLGVVSTSFDPALRASIAFTSDTGNYDWELRDAGNVLVASGSAVWNAGQPIGLNGFELQLNGVPKNGDALGVDGTPFPANNNGNALALIALRDEALVLGASVGDAYVTALADIGVRVQGARSSVDISQAVAADAERSRAGVAGVNLDEEAARLIQYQQSYQAAAKVLSVAQSLFDTLLQATAR